MTRRVDINCDLGEGAGHDADILPYISSINIACGFHAGDPQTMLGLVRQASERGIAIGAHPGYADREHFGRRPLRLSNEEVYALILYQLGALDAICRAAGVQLQHIKPHGALYNQAASDPLLADAVCRAVEDFDQHLLVYALAGSAFHKTAAEKGIKTVSEVFADRSYLPDGSLCPRSQPGALIETTSAAVDQAMEMILHGRVKALDGTVVAIQAESICLHGDGENAVAFAKALHTQLVQENIEIRAYDKSR